MPDTDVLVHPDMGVRPVSKDCGFERLTWLSRLGPTAVPSADNVSTCVDFDAKRHGNLCLGQKHTGIGRCGRRYDSHHTRQKQQTDRRERRSYDCD